MLSETPAGGHSGHFASLLSDPNFHIFYRAPVLILISEARKVPGLSKIAHWLPINSFMLAAYAVGLGSCWIGFAQSFLNTSAGKSMLGLPAAWVPVAPIIVGHPNIVPPPVTRKEPVIRRVG